MQAGCPGIRIAEIHPGGAMVLRGAPAMDVRGMKKDSGARKRLLHWLECRGLKGAASPENPPDHYVAACAAALGAWRWHLNDTVWQKEATPPFHPFDYVC